MFYRYYVQLPLPSAHEYHYDVPTRGGNGVTIPQISTHTQTQESQTGEVISEDNDANNEKKHRLHPLVAQKIREIVAGGEIRVYHVRRLLRFVEYNLIETLFQLQRKHILYCFTAELIIYCTY